MKQFFLLVLLIAIGFGAYKYYRHKEDLKTAAAAAVESAKIEKKNMAKKMQPEAVRLMREIVYAKKASPAQLSELNSCIEYMSPPAEVKDALKDFTAVCTALNSPPDKITGLPEKYTTKPRCEKCRGSGTVYNTIDGTRIKREDVGIGKDTRVKCDACEGTGISKAASGKPDLSKIRAGMEQNARIISGFLASRASAEKETAKEKE